MNHFLYVSGNPLSVTDPLGLQAAAIPGRGGMLIPIPGSGGGKGGYDLRTDTFTPNPSYSLPKECLSKSTDFALRR